MSLMDDYDAQSETNPAFDVPSPSMTDDAPYGRKADGSPKAKPGPKGAGTTRTRTRRTTAKKTTIDYRPGILGILQLPAFALGAASQFNPTLALDGAAISLHAPAIAEALNQLADDNPAVAAALDRILSAGPYGAIIGACLPLAFQIAANHKRIPDMLAKSVGAMPAGEFEQYLIAMRNQPGV